MWLVLVLLAVLFYLRFVIIRVEVYIVVCIAIFHSSSIEFFTG